MIEDCRSSQPTITVGDSAPTSPSEDDLWFDTVSKEWYLYENGVWVSTSGSVIPYMMQPANSVPTAGRLSFNNPDPALVSEIHIHSEDFAKSDHAAFLDTIKAGDWANIFLQSDANVYQQYYATGPAVKNGDYYDVPVSYSAHLNGPLADGNLVYAYWRTGDTTTAWGQIEGTLADQTDLQAALDAKAAAAHAANHATGQADAIAPGDIGAADLLHASDHATGQADAIAPGDIGAADLLHASDHATGQADAIAPGDIGAITSTDGSVIDVLSMTQATYDGLTPDPTTLYLITP